MEVLWLYEMAIVLGRMESGTVTAEPRLKTYSLTRRCHALSANATLDDLASGGLLGSAYSCNEMKQFYTIVILVVKYAMTPIVDTLYTIV